MADVYMRPVVGFKYKMYCVYIQDFIEAVGSNICAYAGRAQIKAWSKWLERNGGLGLYSNTYVSLAPNVIAV